MEATIFGLTEAQVARLGLTVGLAAFVLYMVFIIVKLAQESKAGKFGTFVLFLALALGIVGFIVKGIIKWAMGL